MADLAARDPWVLAEFAVTETDAGAAGAALEGIGYAGDDDGAEDGADGASARPLFWWWTCPAHPDHRRDERRGPDGGSAHGEGCAQPVVPRTEWPAR